MPACILCVDLRVLVSVQDNVRSPRVELERKRYSAFVILDVLVPLGHVVDLGLTDRPPQ